MAYNPAAAQRHAHHKKARNDCPYCVCMCHTGDPADRNACPVHGHASSNRVRVGLGPTQGTSSHLDPSRDANRVTHGRHCSCTPCRAQDWNEPGLAPCGMHPDGCPPDAHATRNRVRVSFKHEDSGGYVDGEFRENEPAGKIHVSRDGYGPMANLWGTITVARRLAEVIEAEFHAY